MDKSKINFKKYIFKDKKLVKSLHKTFFFDDKEKYS